jgi:hypothetical protein
MVLEKKTVEHEHYSSVIHVFFAPGGAAIKSIRIFLFWKLWLHSTNYIEIVMKIISGIDIRVRRRKSELWE